MGYESFDWDGEPTTHTATCPACDADIECNREWRVHVEGARPEETLDPDRYDAGEFKPHSYTCSHDSHTD